jgi:hypothetical protein
MSLAHVLWRLAERRRGPLSIRLTMACRWPGCGVQRVELVLVINPEGEKPDEMSCPVCARPLHLLSGERGL